jgi:hypothetical protein
VICPAPRCRPLLIAYVNDHPVFVSFNAWSLIGVVLCSVEWFSGSLIVQQSHWLVCCVFGTAPFCSAPNGCGCSDCSNCVRWQVFECFGVRLRTYCQSR